MCEATYYERNRDVILKRAKDYYENNKAILRKRAKNKYRELPENGKDVKGLYQRSRYHDMSDEKKKAKAKRISKKLPRG